MTFTIEPFDLASASTDARHEYYDFITEIDRVREPDDPVAPFDVAMLDWEPPSHERLVRWIARDGGDMVGATWLELEYVETNRHLAWFDITVRADRRREGIGRALLDEVSAAARADDRSVIGTTVTGTDPKGDDDPFVIATGFDKRMVERRSRLLLAELDRTMLEDWVARAKERASEYSLIGYDDVCPEEWLDAYVGVTDVMNTAPREDLDMEDWHFTPARVREREERRARTNRWHWTLMARHEPTGEFAGFTEVDGAAWMDDLAWQGGTAVDPKHRDKGLGRWLKAAMALRILDERPEIARVDTWNAGTNRPMLAINVTMGFKPVRYYADWQKTI